MLVGLRRWLGTHPVLAINLVTLFVPVGAAVGYMQAAGLAYNAALLVSNEQWLASFLLVPGVSWLSIASATCGVVVILTRAGLPPRRSSEALRWTPLVAILHMAMLTAILLTLIPSGGSLGGSIVIADIFGGLMLATFYASAQTAGGGLGRLWSYWRKRGGRWEVTAPSQGGAAGGSLQRSVAGGSRSAQQGHQEEQGR